MNNMDKAIEKFISRCWKKVDDYYKEAVKGKKIYIYGSGIYGCFIYNAMCKLGYSNQIMCFINDFVIDDNEKLFGISVKKCKDINFESNYIILVGIQDNSEVIKNLIKNKLNYLVADTDQSFYQDNLMYSVFKCIEVSPVSDMVGKIKQYYEKMYDKDDEILSIYHEDISKSIIQNRLNFYKTGDCSYIDNMYVNYKQYFNDDYCNISENEIYVDCGAFDGDSINSFIEYTKGAYKKIIGIEPDKISYKKLENNTKNYHDIDLIHCATGKENSTACFASKGLLGSTYSSDDGDIVDVKKLDDILKDTITIIKMDIEGAELDSLKGAEKIIKMNKPKLIICIYHKIEDIKSIPLYLHSIVPEYKFKVRQHAKTMLDTVLYAEI